MTESDSRIVDVPVQDVKSLFSKTKKKVKAVNVSTLPAPPPPQPMVDRTADRTAKGEGWEQEFQRLDAFLRCAGLQIEKVASDGSCLFSSFAVHFPGVSSDVLREEAVEYMLSHPNDFEPFVDSEIYPLGFQDYCLRMRRPQTWGSQLEIQALSLVKEVNVYVFQTGGKSTIKMINFDNGKLVTVSYHDGEHYNSVLSVTGDPLTVESVDAAMQPKECYVDTSVKPTIKPKKKSLFN